MARKGIKILCPPNVSAPATYIIVFGGYPIALRRSPTCTVTFLSIKLVVKNYINDATEGYNKHQLMVEKKIKLFKPSKKDVMIEEIKCYNIQRNLNYENRQRLMLQNR